MKIIKSNKFFFNFDCSIEVKEIKSKEDMFSLLHEYGHSSHKHNRGRTGPIDLRDVLQECKAWSYALSCVRQEYHEELVKFAISCVQTYNADAEINYGEWLSKDEIIRAIFHKEERN